MAARRIAVLTSTAASHPRTFIARVMGRNCGCLALYSALAIGAERVYLPEEGVTLQDMQLDIEKLN
jgi:6-phosphofructokinase 1